MYSNENANKKGISPTNLRKDSVRGGLQVGENVHDTGRGTGDDRGGGSRDERDERQKDDCEFGGEHCYTRRVSERRILGEVEQVLVCTVEFEGLLYRVGYKSYHSLRAYGGSESE